MYSNTGNEYQNEISIRQSEVSRPNASENLPPNNVIDFANQVHAIAGSYEMVVETLDPPTPHTIIIKEDRNITSNVHITNDIMDISEQVITNNLMGKTKPEKKVLNLK